MVTNCGLLRSNRPVLDGGWRQFDVGLARCRMINTRDFKEYTGGSVAVPDYQRIMLPLLSLLADGRDRRTMDLLPELGEHFQLSDQDVTEMLPSGQRVFYNRVHWAKSYLGKAGLLIVPARGFVRITDQGRAVLADHPGRIDVAYLSRFPSFEAFRHASSKKTPSVTSGGMEETDAVTPEELLEQTWRALQQQGADELLDRVRQCSPAFFERLVVDLLVAMGYGGSRVEAGQSIGRSGDGGIDGIINEDRLGLDTVYVQAKRWGATVGRPVVQNFAGSLEGVRARKGVIITTSTFTQEAKSYVQHIEKRIVLIDGATLADLMLEHDVGVTTSHTYAVKRLDLDYFEEG